MASKDYDDLLESFMNNSQNAYKEDLNSRENSSHLPASYSDPASQDKKKIVRGRDIDKKRAKKKKANTPLAMLGRFILAMIMIAGVVSVVCFSVITIYGYSVVYGDPVFDLTEEKFSQNQTSFIYGYDGDKVVEITRLHGEENRIWVNLEDMSEYLPQAFVSIEDKRFKEHHGVDWIRTVGVFVKQNNQGGSTITQQLIKNLTDDNKVTYIRKFNEILRALNLERNYSKDEILEAYLNTIYLSNGCYGVKTAAERYFGKEVKDLNAAECASIASITQYPSRYDPLYNPEKNRERQLNVLYAMKENGVFSSDSEYEDAKNYEMIFTNSKNYKGSQLKDTTTTEKKNNIESYYVDYVISTVQEDLQKMGYTSRKAHDLVYGGGLKIYTAIDFNVQDSLEDVYENYKRMPDETVQGAMCIMDYHGRVMGIVGGTGKKKAAMLLNRASQSKRPPGSSIKPLAVYGPALEKSAQDDDVEIYWSTVQSDSPFRTVEGKPWPVNQGGGYSSRGVTLQYGLSRSLNTISARTLDKIGVDYSYEFVTENFHLTTLDSIRDIDYGPLAIGSLTNGATVLELTAAYAAFGNGGYYYEPYCYYKIEDSQGNIVINKEPEKTKSVALSETTSWLMNKLLQTVMSEGTGTTYRLSGIECFGKTGTTNDDKDRWFVGGTPDFIAATWYGYDIPKEVHYSLSSNPSGTIWKTVMDQIYTKYDENNTDYSTKFPECENLVRKPYCSYCGNLSSGGSYGWYDVDNLPPYCNSGHGYTDKEEDEEEEKTTKKNNKPTEQKPSVPEQETTQPVQTEVPSTDVQTTDVPEEPPVAVQ